MENKYFSLAFLRCKKRSCGCFMEISSYHCCGCFSVGFIFGLRASAFKLVGWKKLDLDGFCSNAMILVCVYFVLHYIWDGSLYIWSCFSTIDLSQGALQVVQQGVLIQFFSLQIGCWINFHCNWFVLISKFSGCGVRKEWVV